MSKFDLFRKLYKWHTKGNAWLDTLPNEINESFFDNPYVGSLRRQLDFVQAAVFTEDQLSDIDWFLFDWSVTPTLTWKIDDVEYSFSGIDEYIQFLQEHRSEVWDEESQPKPELVEYASGTRAWYLNGKIHRTDGPAVEEADGTRMWYLNGKRHRTDGPAVEYGSGTRMWWLNGKRHRTDGPAYEGADGIRAWYSNGQSHRVDGPAVEYADGTRGWWLNGEEYSFDYWCRRTNKTEEEIAKLKEQYYQE